MKDLVNSSKKIAASLTDKNMRISELSHRAIKHCAMRDGITMRKYFDKLARTSITRYNKDMQRLTRQ
jgi:predicted DNA binding CopG/RHH family protein